MTTIKMTSTSPHKKQHTVEDQKIFLFFFLEMGVVGLLLFVSSVAFAVDLRPVSVTFLTRHGARSPYIGIKNLPPNELEVWNCSFTVFQYPQIAPVSPQVSFNGQLYRKVYLPHREALKGNCSQGELTNVGAGQLRDTGSWLRSLLNGFLPPQWDPNTMFARSTDLDRTYATAENLLQILFPPRNANGSFSDVINIWTIEKGYDDLDVAQNAACPALTNRCHEISTSSVWEQHIQSLAPLIQEIAKAFEIPVDSVPDIFLVLNQLRARKAAGMALPFSNDVYLQVEAAASWELKQLYSDPLVHQLTSGQIVREMIDNFEAIINGTKKRIFTLYAAHDTTIAPLMSALQIPWTTWPQYAANLYMGLNIGSDGNYYVQILHDRNPVVSACGQLCTWDEFKAIAEKVMLTDTQRAQICAKVSRKRAVFVDPVVDYLC